MLIGELADATGASAKTLRYYEREGLLHEPVRTSAGYRDYSPDVIQRVLFIRQAQAAGLTLRQISEILAISDEGQPPCRHVAQLVDERLEELQRRLRELRRTRQRLGELRQRLDVLDPVECAPGGICSAITG